MDLQIAGRSALVTACSHGLGRACPTELARAGCRLTLNGRTAADLKATAAALREEFGVAVTTVAGDGGIYPGVL